MVNNKTDEPPLKGWLAMSFGLLALTLGAVWMLQGLDLLTNHMMSGESVWTVIGGVTGVIGLALVIIGMRRRTAGKNAPVTTA